MPDNDSVDEARERIELRLRTARMQWKRMPPAAPSKGHAGGIVAGLEEALTLLGQSVRR